MAISEQTLKEYNLAHCEQDMNMDIHRPGIPELNEGIRHRKLQKPTSPTTILKPSVECIKCHTVNLGDQTLPKLEALKWQSPGAEGCSPSRRWQKSATGGFGTNMSQSC